jgi:hypothetical protein
MRDLYYNTPARRKFLKSDNTEFAHCAEAVKRIALAHPEVAFTLTHNGRVSLHLPRSDTRERVPAPSLARTFSPSRASLDARAGPLRVSGYCALPAYSRARSDAQYCYVNGRFVRDKLLEPCAARGLPGPAARQPLPGLLPVPGGRSGDCRRQCPPAEDRGPLPRCARGAPVCLSCRAAPAVRSADAALRLACQPGDSAGRQESLAPEHAASAPPGIPGSPALATGLPYQGSLRTGEAVINDAYLSFVAGGADPGCCRPPNRRGRWPPPTAR